MEKILNNTKRNIQAQATRLGLKRLEGREKEEILTEKQIKSGKYHICWYCEYATDKYIGYCDWSHKLKPVKGWKIKNEKNGSFRLIDCPLFRKDEKNDK